MAKTRSISIQMKEILDEFSEKVNDVLENAANTAADESAQKLQNTSPRKSGEYASGWTVEKKGKGYTIVYNKEGWKTMLLENGHVIRNKKGTYGRAPAHKHIKPVETWANREFQRLIKEGIER